MTRCVLWLCLSLILPLPAIAQQAEEKAPLAARSFDVERATSPVKVDGVLDEQAWRDALVYDIPYEWLPGDNTPAPVKTDFLVTYDNDFLYAAWRCFDPQPAAIRAHLMDRDEIATLVQDDHVMLMIDTFNDERRGFQIRVNPLGVQADAVFSQNEGIEDFSYDMIWDSAGRINEEGYFVEVAIPLDQIRFPRTSGRQTWGFDVGRSYPRAVRHRLTAWPRDRSNSCVLCQVDKVTGFENLEPGRNLEVTPTVTALRTDKSALRGVPGDLQQGDTEFEPGVSVRWGVTPNMSVNATVNPDFSQVEADVAQLDVNERFALFFEEKRPFFLEGIDIFSTPVQAVFTRTVIDPEWGLKLTGKEGGNTFGVFVASDVVNRVIIPSNQRSDLAVIDQDLESGVLRFRRDVGQGSSVGLLFTGREGEDYHNRVAGLDGFIRITRSDSVRLQYVRSDTLYPERVARAFDQSLDAFEGNAFMADWNHQTRNWVISVFYQDMDPSFRADSGFVPRTDIRDARTLIQRQFWGKRGGWYTQINTGYHGTRVEDHSGRLTDQSHAVFATYAGRLQSAVEVRLEQNKEFFQGVLYDDLNLVRINSSMQPGGSARLALGITAGDTVDFQNNRRAETLAISPGAELKLGQHVNAQLSHTLQQLDVAGGELFEANLSQLRLVYNFNVRMFVRGIFQYLDLQRDPSLFTFRVAPETQTLFTQLLFSYKLNPQTVLFLGYSDNQLGLQDIELDRTDRSFFFKVGYAWTM